MRRLKLVFEVYDDGHSASFSLFHDPRSYMIPPYLPLLHCAWTKSIVFLTPKRVALFRAQETEN